MPAEMLKNTLLVRYAEGSPQEIFVKWEEDVFGEWIAYLPHEDPEQSQRLHDLDALDFTGVMAVTQQIMRGDLPRVYLEPRESALKRRLQLSCNASHGEDPNRGVDETTEYCDGTCQRLI